MVCVSVFSSWAAYFGSRQFGACTGLCHFVPCRAPCVSGGGNLLPAHIWILLFRVFTDRPRQKGNVVGYGGWAFFVAAFC